MARKEKAATAPEAEAVRQAKFEDGMVYVRSVSGGVLIDPYTHIRFEAEPQKVVITSWVQCQIDARKLEVVGD